MAVTQFHRLFIKQVKMASHVYDVGDEAPDFRLDSQVGLISFHDFIDSKWCCVLTFGHINDPVR
jgi:hypothetical protein